MTGLTWESPIVAANSRCSQETAQQTRFISGKKKEHKPKLLGPDIFWWGGGLPREGVGAKKFGMSLETQENHIPGAPEKLEKSLFNSWPLFSRLENPSLL